MFPMVSFQILIVLIVVGLILWDHICGYLAYLSPIREGWVNEYWTYIP